MEYKAQILWFVLLATNCFASQESLRKFPEDFIFGAATSSYQIEGGWNADDKGEDIWDRITHTRPDLFKDGSNGDVAADSYHDYKRDVQLMRELDLDAYRFSLSWARILPKGRVDYINHAGVEYYNNYINEMLKYNITPIVTLFHWDLPQALQELGGFFNPEISVWLEEYSRVVFALFGDRVKRWLTNNEPNTICMFAAKLFSKDDSTGKGIGEYLCAKNMAMAHAAVYRTYVRDFKEEQKGECGLTISIQWYGPLTDSAEDEEAAKIKRQSDWGIYAHPIYSKEGGFPKELSERVAAKSCEQGYNTSRMPEFTEEEKAFVRGTYDFFGLNHYTAKLVSATQYKEDNPVPSLEDDADVGTHVPEEWMKSVASWLTLSPNSMYNVLTNIKQEYQIDPTFFIFENSWATPAAKGIQDLLDFDRIKYLRASLQSLLDAIYDGVRVKGYFVWSLMDNFEWLTGYTLRFGLYQVDVDKPSRPRKARLSALVYKDIIKKGYVDCSY